jgi:hypothetical protein
VQAFFGAVLGIDTLRPNASAIAAVDGAGEVNCLIPFGLNASVLAGANFGDIITITGPSPGNWGKIDIDGNMSSNPVFVAAMTNLLCTSGVSIGDQFDPGTGFAGVLDGFEGRIALNPIVILPVVDHFPNGNSSKVTVVGFVAAKLLTNDQVPNGNQGNPASNNGNGNSGSSSAPGNSGNSNKNKNSGGNGNSNGNSGNSGNSSSNGNSGNSQNSGSNWSNKIELLNMVIGNRGGGPFVPPYAPFVGLVE